MSEFPADILLGASAIAKKLQQLGLIKEGDANAASKTYYIAAKGRLPISRFGKSLIASGTKLEQAAKKLVT